LTQEVGIKEIEISETGRIQSETFSNEERHKNTNYLNAFRT